jgi:outer membrane protein TolC
MTSAHRWLLVGALLLLATSAAAGDLLTLDAAIRQALTHNASIRAAKAGVEEAAARSDQSRSSFFPKITFSESWQRGDQPVFVFSSLLAAREFGPANLAIDALNHPDPIGAFRASVGLEQLVFDGGRQRATVQAAREDRIIAQASSDEVTAAVVVATTEAFGRVVRADALKRAIEADLATAREDLARTERRRDLGMATDADVLALAVHVSTLRQQAIQADGDGAVARAEVSRLMGAPIDSAIEVVPLSDLEGAPTPPLAVLMAEAEAARPELKRAAAAVRAADAARRQAHAALVPQVAVQAAFDLSGTRFADRASSWIVGGGLRWSFSTGGAETAGTRAALAALARTKAEEDEASAAVHVEVISSLRRLESARARQEAGRASVEQARESQRIVRDRVEAGLAPINDLLRASGALLDAEASRTAALVDTVLSAAALRRALGRVP